MIVYGSSLSPFVRKVLVFAAEKGIPVENIIPRPHTDEHAEFRKASPFGKIPALRHNDFTISDSSAIVTYLDAIGPEPKLIPDDPRAHARTVWYDEFADTILFGTGVKMFFNRIVAPLLFNIEGDLAAAEKAEKEELPPIVDYLESIAPASGFLIGDRLTLADIAVASPWVNFAHLGIAMDPATHPRASAYIAAILARPSFAGLIANEKAFLASRTG